MKELLEIAKRPPVCTHPGATVHEVCASMMAEQVGAIAVVEDGKLIGIISERDIVGRVVLPRLDPETTLVSQVMTKNPRTASATMSIAEALQHMQHGHFRHLPVLDGEGRIAGMVSMRHVLRVRADELDLRNNDLTNFIAADGPGG